MILNSDYDRAADVLYLMIGDQNVPSEFEDTPDGVTVRYAVSDMHPIGVVIVGYDQYGWSTDHNRLARVVGGLLSLAGGEVKRAVEWAT